MNELISNYKNKYLKYKNKYLNLKYGGNSKYIPPHQRTYYIDIKHLDDIYFKNELERKLEENGYHLTEKKNASFVFLFDNPKYDPLLKNKRNHEFSNIHLINSLWGDLKEIITNKVKFHEKFGGILQNYFIPWNIVKYETIEDDLRRINISENNPKILKASNSYLGMGTKVVRNYEDMKNHILSHQSKNLLTISNAELIAKSWIVEDYIKTDLIENRVFFIRVHLLIIKTEANNKLEIFISNKQPYIIKKIGCNDETIMHECIDTQVGQNLKILTGSGVNGNIDTSGKKIPYKYEGNAYWPNRLPDGYNSKDIENINRSITDLFTLIFKNKQISHTLTPDYNSKNGYEIFGCDISFQNKQVKLHEINRRTELILQAPFIEDILKIASHDKNFNHFIPINL
jgi:hypothetical protein